MVGDNGVREGRETNLGATGKVGGDMSWIIFNILQEMQVQE